MLQTQVETKAKIKSMLSTVLIIAGVLIIFVVLNMYVLIPRIKDNARQLDYKYASADIPFMFSEDDFRLLHNLANYLEGVLRFVRLKIDNDYPCDQLFKNIEPLLFEGTTYTVESAQKRSLEIINEIRSYPPFLANEILLQDFLHDFRPGSAVKYQRCGISSDYHVQHGKLFAALMINAQMYFLRSEYAHSASVLETIVSYMEARSPYGNVHMLHKKDDYVLIINWMEEIAPAKKLMPPNDTERFIECFRRLKRDVYHSHLTYLNYQRFNFSFPILGISYPHTHLIDIKDVLDMLNMIDEYNARFTIPSQNVVTKEDVDFAFQSLLEAYDDFTAIDLATSGTHHLIPPYFVLAKRHIQYYFLYFSYIGNKLDKITQQMTAVE